MARTKETKMSPEQQEKMTQEVVASLQSSTYGKDYAQKHSSFFEEVENSDLEVVTENVAATTSCMEDELTNEAQSPPNPQKRISGKQRKATYGRCSESDHTVYCKFRCGYRMSAGICSRYFQELFDESEDRQCLEDV